jgi:hypothetical protein
MSRYRVIQKDYAKVTAPEYIGATLETEHWRGDNPPTDEDLAAFGPDLRANLPVITQERFLILQLGKRAIPFGWRNVYPGAEVPLPPNYQIVTPALQFKEQQQEGVTSLHPVVEDTAIWKSDYFPNFKEWSEAALVARLEAQMLAPAFGEEGDAPIAEGPIIQKTRYIKFGRKLRHFSPFSEPTPNYV